MQESLNKGKTMRNSNNNLRRWYAMHIREKNVPKQRLFRVVSPPSRSSNFAGGALLHRHWLAFLWLMCSLMGAWGQALIQNGSFEIGPVKKLPNVGNILKNGSFEQGDHVGEFDVYPSSHRGLTGWSIDGTINPIGTHWTAANGGRSVDLDGGGPGAIYQKVPTVESGKYRIRFKMSANPHGSGPRSVRVTASVFEKVFTFYPPANHDRFGNMGWQQMEMDFYAYGVGDTTIRFQSLSPKGSLYGPALDDIEVRPITPAEDFRTYFVGSTVLDGWRVVKGSVDAVFSEHYEPAHGTVCLDLDGYEPGAIETDLGSLPIGTLVRVPFKLEGNRYIDGPRQIRVSIDGNSKTFTFKPASIYEGTPFSDRKGKLRWIQQEVRLRTQKPNPVLKFESLSPKGSRFGASIDNVAAYVVPEPIIKVDPLRVSATLLPNKTYDAKINVSNTGVSDLTFSAGKKQNWVSIQGVAGTLSAGKSSNIQVQFRSGNLAPGVYKDTLVIQSNDPAKPSVPVELTLEVVGLPAIALNPNPLTMTLYQGQTKVNEFSITNTGGSALNWSIASADNGWWQVSKSSGNLSPGGRQIGRVVGFYSEGYLPGIYQDKLWVTSTDKLAPPVSLDLILEVLPNPVDIQCVSVNPQRGYPYIDVIATIDLPEAIAGTLPDNHFAVFEGDQRVSIVENVFMGEKKGADIVFVIDNSGSMKEEIEALKTVAPRFVLDLANKGLNARFGVVSFVETIQVVADLTDDAQLIAQELGKLKLADGGKEEIPLDAVVAALEQLDYQAQNQPFIILASDALAHYRGDGSSHSQYTIPEVAARFNSACSGLTVISDVQDVNDMVPSEDNNLKVLAAKAHGRWYSMNDPKKGFAGILDDLIQIIGSSRIITYKSMLPETAPNPRSGTLYVQGLDRFQHITDFEYSVMPLNIQPIDPPYQPRVPDSQSPKLTIEDNEFGEMMVRLKFAPLSESSQFRLEYSTDLKNWYPATTSGALTLFSETMFPGGERIVQYSIDNTFEDRFYRVSRSIP